MQKQDFHFDLPESLIAYKPCENRTDSRLMVVDPVDKSIEDKQFFELLSFLRPEDCLIFNNTKVIPARLNGKRESGGKVEILIERVYQKNGQELCIAQLRASNTPKPGAQIIINDSFRLEVVGREGSFFVLRGESDDSLLTLIEQYGTMPLPPYIQRDAEEVDKDRYQTVYAEKKGAVAAPTAGLHFDESLLQRIKEKDISTGFVTLHVGAGTFSPVRVDNIQDHQMHSEWFEVPQSVVDLVNATRAKGGRVIAVGTTSVRCLESASISGMIEATKGETNIFIYPGYQFKSVDALITNFHLSESTLIMLVSAFAGKDFTLNAYNHAVNSQYRFFSYGDSMFITRKKQNRAD